jgi:hypothetical protein
MPLNDYEKPNYGPGDKISRKQAWADLLHDFYRIGHATVDIGVNLVRLVGVSDRDTSQKYGRPIGIALIVAAVVGLGIGWFF